MQATGTRLEGAGEVNRWHKYHRVLMRHSREKSTCVTERRIRKLLEKRELRVKILETMPDGNQKREDYQWDVIFDGNPRLLEKDVDFTCTPRGLRLLLIQRRLGGASLLKRSSWRTVLL